MAPLIWLALASSLAVPTLGWSLEKRATLGDCLTSAKVPVFTSGTSNYTQAVKPFNLRLPFKPASLAVPETVKQVQDAVTCGVNNGALVTARSGGHSYGAHGLGGEDGHLIIDLRRFNNVTVDAKAHTAVVGAGGRLGNIALALYDQGKQAMSHGTCPGYVVPPYSIFLFASMTNVLQCGHRRAHSPWWLWFDLSHEGSHPRPANLCKRCPGQ